MLSRSPIADSVTNSRPALLLGPKVSSAIGKIMRCGYGFVLPGFLCCGQFRRSQWCCRLYARGGAGMDTGYVPGAVLATGSALPHRTVCRRFEICRTVHWCLECRPSGGPPHDFIPCKVSAGSSSRLVADQTMVSSMIHPSPHWRWRHSGGVHWRRTPRLSKPITTMTAPLLRPSQHNVMTTVDSQSPACGNVIVYSCSF